MRFKVTDAGRQPEEYKWPILKYKIWYITLIVFFSLTALMLTFYNRIFYDGPYLNTTGACLFVLDIVSFFVALYFWDKRKEIIKVLQLLSQGPKTVEEIHKALQRDPMAETKKKLNKLQQKGLVTVANNG